MVIDFLLALFYFLFYGRLPKIVIKLRKSVGEFSLVDDFYKFQLIVGMRGRSNRAIDRREATFK